MARVVHDLTDEQWAAVREAWGGCAYCGALDPSPQKDCVLPISRGGRYTLDNVVPACRSCNASKCNDEVTGWLRRKRLDERAFLVRHHEVAVALRLQFPLADLQESWALPRAFDDGRSFGVGAGRSSVSECASRSSRQASPMRIRPYWTSRQNGCPAGSAST